MNKYIEKLTKKAETHHPFRRPMSTSGVEQREFDTKTKLVPKDAPKRSETETVAKSFTKSADWRVDAAQFARRAGRVAKGFGEIAKGVGEDFTGGSVKKVMEERTRIPVQSHPFTGVTGGPVGERVTFKKLPQDELDKLHEMKDSDKLKHIGLLHGSNSPEYHELRRAINKRDATRVAVAGGLGAAALGEVKKRHDENKVNRFYAKVQEMQQNQQYSQGGNF